MARATHHKDPFVVEGEANGEKVVENYEGERLGRLQQQLRQEHRHVYKDPYYESSAMYFKITLSLSKFRLIRNLKSIRLL